MRRRFCPSPCIRFCAGGCARGSGRGRLEGSARVVAGERRAEAEALLDRIRNEGPGSASDFDEKRGRSGWWEWGEAKRALEWLFWAGHITTATRRGS